MYAPAWRAEVASLQAAVQDLDAAVLGGFKGSFKLAEEQTSVGYYVAYAVPGKFANKPDTVELLIKPEGVQDRQWEGDRAGAAVFYRSIAGKHGSCLRGLYIVNYSICPGPKSSLRQAEFEALLQCTCCSISHVPSHLP